MGTFTRLPCTPNTVKQWLVFLRSFGVTEAGSLPLFFFFLATAFNFRTLPKQKIEFEHFTVLLCGAATVEVFFLSWPFLVFHYINTGHVKTILSQSSERRLDKTVFLCYPLFCISIIFCFFLEFLIFCYFLHFFHKIFLYSLQEFLNYWFFFPLVSFVFFSWRSFVSTLAVRSRVIFWINPFQCFLCLLSRVLPSLSITYSICYLVGVA